MSISSVITRLDGDHCPTGNRADRVPWWTERGRLDV